MNYRHIYHAGNFADVFKHIVLMLVIDYLNKKEKPLFLLDTHAGIGRYDLTSEQAGRTGEAEEGIHRLWRDTQQLPEPVRRYLALIRQFNKSGTLRTYPGSPLLMQQLMRPTDRLVANELHPQDVLSLKDALGLDRRVKIENTDGYGLWKASVPPLERRGLVLVDPPFEVRNEFALLAEGLRQAMRRWATGIYALWYPIKNTAEVTGFHEEIGRMNLPDCKAFDFRLVTQPAEERFHGSGLVVVNAPWTLEADLTGLMPALIKRMSDGDGDFRVTNLSPA